MTFRLDELAEHAAAEARPAPAPLYAYDSTTPRQIPKDAAVVLYYGDGAYRWSKPDLDLFPGARRRAITVLGDPACSIGDVETGDMRVADVVDFLRARREDYHGRGCLYANRSTMPAVQGAVLRSGHFGLDDFDVIVATLDGTLVTPEQHRGGGRLVACQDERGPGWDRSRVWVRSWPLRAAAA